MSLRLQAVPASIAAQRDLFTTDSAFTLDESFATARRMTLDATSWIDVVPGWLTGSAQIMDRLRKSVPFQQHDRRLFDQVFREPRLTASLTDLQQVVEKEVLDAARLLSKHYGVEYDSLWLNLYRDGTDSTGWHRDWNSCRRPECIVPVLTLGATRRFLVKPRSGGKAIALRPNSGDLIVMGGRSQEDWVHCVPKDPAIDGPRVSINFQSSVQATRPSKPR